MSLFLNIHSRTKRTPFFDSHHVEKFIDNDVMDFERVLRDIEKILLLK